jgi:hypothetical protein
VKIIENIFAKRGGLVVYAVDFRVRVSEVFRRNLSTSTQREIRGDLATIFLGGAGSARTFFLSVT